MGLHDADTIDARTFPPGFFSRLFQFVPSQVLSAHKPRFPPVGLQLAPEHGPLSPLPSRTLRGADVINAAELMRDQRRAGHHPDAAG